MPKHPKTLFLFLILTLCVYSPLSFSAVVGPVSTGVKAGQMKLYRTGFGQDKKVQARFGVCVAGGGDDEGWADGWSFLLSNAAGGDVLIIREDGDRGGYESWLYYDESHLGFPKVNSVSTLSLAGRGDGDRPEAIRAVENAELVFFAGGDQSHYVAWLKGSKLIKVLQKKLDQRQVSIGGTSAGMAFLAGIDYTAKYTPADSEGFLAEEVLADPAGQFVDLDLNDLRVPFLRGTVTDMHCDTYNRVPRMVGFMGRAAQDRVDGVTPLTIRGIGADEAAAVCFGADGVARVVGQGNGYFVLGRSNRLTVKKGLPMEWVKDPANDSPGALEAYVLHSKVRGGAFNLHSWSGQNGIVEDWQVMGTAQGPKLVRVPRGQ